MWTKDEERPIDLIPWPDSGTTATKYSSRGLSESLNIKILLISQSPHTSCSSIILATASPHHTALVDQPAHQDTPPLTTDKPRGSKAKFLEEARKILAQLFNLNTAIEANTTSSHRNSPHRLTSPWNPNTQASLQRHHSLPLNVAAVEHQQQFDITCTARVPTDSPPSP